MPSCETCEIFNNSYFEEHLWTTASKLIQKETPTQAFFCEFYKLFKDICFKEHLGTADSKTPVREFLFKGTLIQIWKSANIFVFVWKWYVEGFTLKHFLLFEIWAREICEKVVYKHSETIEYVKN